MYVNPKKYSKPVFPIQIFNYVYAVLSSPKYRTKYYDFSRIDFSRIPFPENYDIFDSLSLLGKDLVELHLGKTKMSGEINRMLKYFLFVG